MKDLPEHLSGNIAIWQQRAPDDVEPAERAWASDEPWWGIWSIPEPKLKLLPEDMSGMRALEIGCGSGYVSGWMARRGADVVAIDPTKDQLKTATRLCAEHGLDIHFEEGYGESLDFLDATFDFVISEYGAALWANPYQWIPEASRVLRPAGRLILLTNSPFMVMCAPDYEQDGSVGERLLRPYFGMFKTRWPDQPNATEFHLTHGEWISLFVKSGLVVERLVEIQAPPDAATRYLWADAAWAQKWPAEEVWCLRKDHGDSACPDSAVS